MKVTINKEEAEMINKALKFIAKGYKQKSIDADDISTSILFEQFETEYIELSNKFPY